MKKMEPLNDQIVLEKIEGEETSKGGLILPTGADKNKSLRGRVVSVGPGRWDREYKTRVAPCVKAGDVVIYSKFEGYDYTVDGKEYKVVPESAVLVRLS